MPDRIPELDHLAADAKKVDMLPPSEIRRRGNRRRTTRHVSVAAGVMALVLTAGVGVWQSPLLDQLRTPQWANTAIPQTPSPTASDGATEVPTQSPSPSPTPQPTETVTSGSPVVPPTDPTVAPPSYANLPTAEMLFLDQSPGVIKNEFEGLGVSSLCVPGEVGAPITVLSREYGREGDWPAYISAAVLGYATPEEASAGFDLLKADSLTCADVDPKFGAPSEVTTRDQTDEVPFDDSAVDASPARMSYVTGLMILTEPEKEGFGVFTDTVVVQAGERVLLLTSAFEGMDNNCEPSGEDPDIGQCQLPAAIPEAIQALVEPS